MSELSLVNPSRLVQAVYECQQWMPFRLAYTLYYTFVVWPLQQLYVRGWWRNMPPEDICAHLTNYKSDFWLQHSTECNELISNHFSSYLVWILFAFYVYVVYAILKMCQTCTRNTNDLRRRNYGRD